MSAKEPDCDRDRLLREIISSGIFHGSAERPILSRDGELGGSWIMSFLGVGLREPWLSLASDFLLEELKHFQGRQIATMGNAASSLLAGCVLRGKGTYNGLLVRPEPKAHGSGKQIEGVPDRSEPVVIIDDAIGSGFSALKCIEILENDGFEVEGVISVVRFTYNSGYGLLQEHGYQVRALYDLYEDITPILEPESTPEPNPWRARDIVWRDCTAPDGLSPFALARQYLNDIVQHGAVSRAPDRTAAEPASPGGLWISLRDVATGQPAGRIGVWRFPDEPDVSFTTLLAEACWWLARQIPDAMQNLDQYGIGLSLIGPLMPCTPGEANNATFGLVCRSRERPWVIGSALPDMPGIFSTAHQLRHAMFVNGELRSREPFDLFRHSVTKLIEPGALWPDGGRSALVHTNPDARDSMANAILDRVRAILVGTPVDDGKDLFLFDASYLFVSVYHGDALTVCLGSRCDDVPALDMLAQTVSQHLETHVMNSGSAHLQLSVLSDPWSEMKPPAFTPGRDALGLKIGGEESILLPGVAVEENQDAEAFAAMLAGKAGATDVHDQIWTRYRVSGWISSPDKSHLSRHPSCWVARHQGSDTTLDATARGWFRWIADHIAAGSLPEHELPVQHETGDPASPALYAEAVRRLQEAAPALGETPPPIPFDLIPRDPDVLTLVHASGATRAVASGDLDTRLKSRLATISPRLDPIGFWRAVEVLETNNKRAARWQSAPLSTFQRIIRLSAMHDEKEADWLVSLVNADGKVNSNDTDVEDTLLSARAAEALAGSTRCNDRAVAKRILSYLARLSIQLQNERIAIRASERQSGLRTELTIAALAAYTRLEGSAT